MNESGCGGGIPLQCHVRHFEFYLLNLEIVNLTFDWSKLLSGHM